MRQLLSLAPAADGATAPPTWDTVIGVLLYPRRPHDPARALLIEDIALTEALTVAWYEANWRLRQ